MTRNRSATLQRLLDSIEAAEKHPDFAYEIVVVLNACTDRSREVLQSYAGRLCINVTDEPKIGISSARNAAIAVSRGRVIAWLDDDVVINRGWFGAYKTALAKYPGAAFFGGPIEPRFEGEIQPWFAKTRMIFEDVFATRRAPEDAPIQFQYLPYGANYAIRSDWQQRYLYDVALGRRQSFLVLGGEETKAIMDMIADGAHGRWIPDAGVEHIVPTSRQTRKYLFRYYAGWGHQLGRADIETSRSSERPRFRELLLEITGAFWRLLRATLGRRPPEVWVPELISLSIVFGRIIGRVSRPPK